MLFSVFSLSLSLHSPVATDPIVSLMQVSATTVRVEWSQPSEGASVTGYVVHYSSNNGVTNSIPGLPSSATSHEITGLTNDGTYSISVEATSEQLSGESETMIITLCECVDLLSQLLFFFACIIL